VKPRWYFNDVSPHFDPSPGSQAYEWRFSLFIGRKRPTSIVDPQESAETFSFRVDKAWRQRCSQRFRNVLAAGPERRGQRLLGHLGVLKNKHSMMAQDGYKIDNFVVEPGLLWWYTHPLEIRANIA
jgi:hypothetical protein